MESKEALEIIKERIEFAEREYAEQIPEYIEALKLAVRLLQADADGRLVVLPCKVGDTVWFIYGSKIYKMRVQGISVTQSRYIILHFEGYPVANIWGDEIGKTVFLTREEAEAALEKMGGEEE